MNVPILDLKRQYKLFEKELEPRIIETLRSGNYVMGNEVLELEKELCEYIKCNYAISCSSGTAALVIALKACRVEVGDEIITTPFTFFATAESIASIGAIPIFVDVEYDTLNLDSTKIEEKITDKTKAILIVDIFGKPANMNKIMEIAKKYNLKVIDDACQAIGAEYDNKKIGSIGDITCFSFFPTKNLGCFGDGGLITTNNEELAIVCKGLREHGGGKIGAQAKDILDKKTKNFNKVEEQNSLYNPYKYYNYLIAYNSRLDAMQAVILRVKLKYLDEWNKKRIYNANFYIKNLQGVADIVLPKEEKNEKCVWHQFVLKTDKKEELGKFLADNNVGTGAFYPVPLHLQKAFEYLNYKQGDLKVAEKLASQTVCLPIFPELTDEELQYVVDKIKEFYEGV